VADAKCADERVLAQNLFQIGELAGRTADLECGAGWAADRYTGRVISAVFEPPEPLDDDRDNFLRTYITDNAAHGAILFDAV
jgi:hypothetical protein